MPWTVEVPLLLLAIPNCDARIQEIPQGLRSSGSVVMATPAVLETSLVWEKPACCANIPEGIASVTSRPNIESVFFTLFSIMQFMICTKHNFSYLLLPPRSGWCHSEGNSGFAMNSLVPNSLPYPLHVVI